MLVDEGVRTLRVALVLLPPPAMMLPSRTITHPTGTSFSSKAVTACKTPAIVKHEGEGRPM